MSLFNKRTGETVTLTFNLTRLLDVGEVISNATVNVTAEIIKVGATLDLTPSNIKLGSTIINDKKVQQRVIGGVTNNQYSLMLTITTQTRVLQELALLIVV